MLCHIQNHSLRQHFRAILTIHETSLPTITITMPMPSPHTATANANATTTAPSNSTGPNPAIILQRAQALVQIRERHCNDIASFKAVPEDDTAVSNWTNGPIFVTFENAGAAETKPLRNFTPDEFWQLFELL